MSADSWLSAAVLARLATKSSRHDSDGSGLQILVERDLARLPGLHNASKDVSADRDGVGIPDATGRTAIDRSASLPEIDPDDCAGSVETFYALPERPASWWARMVCGADQDTISTEDALLVFRYIERRLREQDAARRLRNEQGERLALPEGKSSAPVLSSSREQMYEASDPKTWNEKLDFISTVGQLHEAIETHFGPRGWTALVLLWHEAAGIQEPTSISTRIPETGRTSPPSPASLQSEAEALRSLPGGVRRFWLYEPRVPPCRHQETAGEQEWREDREGDGAWCG